MVTVQSSRLNVARRPGFQLRPLCLVSVSSLSKSRSELHRPPAAAYRYTKIIGFEESSLLSLVSMPVIESSRILQNTLDLLDWGEGEH